MEGKVLGIKWVFKSLSFFGFIPNSQPSILTVETRESHLAPYYANKNSSRKQVLSDVIHKATVIYPPVYLYIVNLDLIWPFQLI